MLPSESKLVKCYRHQRERLIDRWWEACTFWTEKKANWSDCNSCCYRDADSFSYFPTVWPVTELQAHVENGYQNPSFQQNVLYFVIPWALVRSKPFDGHQGFVHGNWVEFSRANAAYFRKYPVVRFSRFPAKFKYSSNSLAIRLDLSTLSIKKSSSLLVRNDGIAVFPPRRVLAPKLLGVFVQFIRHIWPRSITIALSKLPQQLSNTLWLCKIKGCVRRWYAVSFCFDIREE